MDKLPYLANTNLTQNNWARIEQHCRTVTAGFPQGRQLDVFFLRNGQRSVQTSLKTTKGASSKVLPTMTSSSLPLDRRHPICCSTPGPAGRACENSGEWLFGERKGGRGQKTDRGRLQPLPSGDCSSVPPKTPDTSPSN